MKKNDLHTLTYSSSEIKDKTHKIYSQIINQSSMIDKGNYVKIETYDLKLLFSLYDTYFFQGFFKDNYEDKIFFRLSKRMTSAGGKTQRFKDSNTFILSLSTFLIFKTFNDIEREIKINGIICHDRLEASMRIFEHEIIHVIEHILYDTSSCSKPYFKRLSNNIFGHTDVTHRLITQNEIADKTFNLHVGDFASFDYEGQFYKGVISRITKRATVMVKDPEGDYLDSNGNQYIKYYIPISQLTKIEK
ncbi:hypothetical protein B6U98_02580 [Thermoplasmatales archaeon ex4572_165]|nr:MAG: hypothetical protein B6U98_02580 [Thermoplasmatales archaeon ex4572_165]RLF60158.1 MAG: hypothetical protein DRN27_00330 [Thermoplasmata archaeon]